jgi:hypothetical protein
MSTKTRYYGPEVISDVPKHEQFKEGTNGKEDRRNHLRTNILREAT